VLNDIDVDSLTLDQIELVEKISLRLAFQALVWFAPQAWDIFDRSPDDPQDIAEDVTREALGVFRGFSINERLFGTIDFKQARWLPMSFGLVPQALIVDSKAKRAYENARLDLQMSQVSMDVLLESKKEPLQPLLRTAMELRFEGGLVKKAITTVITAHYSYDIKPAGLVGDRLQRIIVAAVPNGLLKERYSPSRQRTIFGVGKQSSSRGEDPRVRIYYATLRSFAAWRVQEIVFAEDGRDQFDWKDLDEEGQLVTIPVSVEARLKTPGAGPSTTVNMVTAPAGGGAPAQASTMAEAPESSES
jgi:Type II restriction enzyme SfiI